MTRRVAASLVAGFLVTGLACTPAAGEPWPVRQFAPVSALCVVLIAAHRRPDAVDSRWHQPQTDEGSPMAGRPEGPRALAGRAGPDHRRGA